MSVAGVAGGAVGTAAGRALGGLIGSVFGPLGTAVGGWLGGRAGAMVGTAVAEAVAAAMEEANEDAEEQTLEGAQAEPCLDCGKVECFNPPDGADPEEFRRQLKEQEDAINNTDPETLLKRIKKFDNSGRLPGEAGNRRQVRERYKQRRLRELEKKYRNEGHANPEQMAEQEVANEMANLAATHTLDLVAGGDGSISGMGDRSINSSIGSQWRGHRVGQLREHAEQARAQGKRMNVTLDVCDPEKENPEGDPDGNGGSGTGADGGVTGGGMV